MAVAKPYAFHTMWARLRGWLADAQRKRPARQLRVKETLALGEKRQLLIVECGSRRLLIGAAGNFMTALAELDRAQRNENGEIE